MTSRKNEILKAVATRLQKVREAVGCSRNEMASRIGITPGGYNKNENAENFPGIETQRRLLEDFDISMNWFLFERGAMFNKEKDVKEREHELEQAVEELKFQLEKERKEHEAECKEHKVEYKKLEGGLRAQEAGLEKKPEVRELLDSMERVPMLYYEIMLHFQKFKVENAGLMEPGLSENSN